ncbi:MAG: hypothetical protein A2X61_16605 [Ignavibacteria bacterium GWB2_35_12]|nr:MAG: hypothetical protein A2X63_14130 [Ignavibacteria bacterium GWA2_35_8]OGU37889.1 MAG: hypothetical protein A2X61_16605 [Ignavibacteria bacterium GWB2_35_12]OGU85810.1 MAG: hypothetical protein A2220_02255 [Ignavibacteria bacterium RIFOXYA2_FULL_35_10]OGV19673.1 MAG: hypothetical protein A2475_10015 [Ignavibacteria bacterium RIFOXYC2_FULL_35_21]
METYISILRGINVSGQKKIQMADLKALYEELKFKNIITYIQSGNVIFKAEKKLSCTELSKKIEKKIFDKYNFEVPVIIRTVAEMKKVITTNPFLRKKGIDTERLYVTFLAEAAMKADLEKIEKLEFNPEKFIIIGKEVYLHCPNGYGRTKLNNNFFENKLNVTATTRNWNTVNRLVEMGEGCELMI